MGLINYYVRFSSDQTSIAAPLYVLLQKTHKFKWTECELRVLNRIQELVTKRKILKLFDKDSRKELFLKMNTSDEGIGAVLKQKLSDGST